MPKEPRKKQNPQMTPGERVRQHIQDKNDVITDEDIKNLNTETGTPSNNNEPGNEPLDIKEDKNRPKDEDKDHRYVTPWDVLDE